YIPSSSKHGRGSDGGPTVDGAVPRHPERPALELPGPERSARCAPASEMRCGDPGHRAGVFCAAQLVTLMLKSLEPSALQPYSTFLSTRVTLDNVDDFAECLWGVSNSLEDLRIYGGFPDPSPFITDQHLSLLTFEDSAEYLCPHLTHITLDNCFNSSDGALAVMVESRCRAEGRRANLATLERIAVTFGGGHQEDSRRLRHMEEDGLIVSLTIVRFGL
ncbi:hypothetical protein C8J57DRAFT_1291591, partial [Mycena rebaudengoi]